jgi:hypothetical protein
MHFHGAYFSNYTAWLMNPLQIKPSAQSVWPVVDKKFLTLVEISKVFKLLGFFKFGVPKV